MLTPKEQIQKAFNEGHLSGSWMIVGPYGVGKKRLAEEISALVLTGSFEGKITNSSEVKWIERGFTEEVKRRIQKKILAGKSVDEEEDTTSRRQEITVDDIRAGLRFFRRIDWQTPDTLPFFPWAAWKPTKRPRRLWPYRTETRR